jgi:hypothetical protein
MFLNRIRTNLKRLLGVPVRDRDQYFPEDFDQDMDYLDGKRGDMWETILLACPSILKGTGIVSVISGTQISYTAAHGFARDAKGIIREMAIAASGTIAPSLSGDGVYHIKASYAEADYGSQRLKVYAPASYYPHTQDSATIVISQSAPTADELCLGGFVVNGGNITVADNAQRSTEAKFNSLVIELANQSVLTQHLDPSVLGSLGSKITQFRGAWARIFDPTEFAPTNEHGKLFYSNTALVTAAGGAQTRLVQEQAYPRSRLDQKQDSDLTGNYITLADSLSEAAQDKANFTPATGLLFSDLHNRVGVYIKTVGSGYTHLRIVLHDASNNNLNQVDIPYADVAAVGANAWIYADLPYNVTPGQPYHYHIYSLNFSGGSTCQIAKSAGNAIAFRELYKPSAGKYGGVNQADVVVIKDALDAATVSANPSTVDDITSPGEGFSSEVAYDLMAVDFSNDLVWQSWGYYNYIGIDLLNGRIKLPNGLLIADHFWEGNIINTFDGIDARSILRNSSGESVEDALIRILAFITGLVLNSPTWSETDRVPTSGAVGTHFMRKTGAVVESINGIKTFTNPPKSSTDAVASDDLVRLGQLSLGGVELGTIWNAQRIPTAIETIFFNTVTYGNGLFVAGGNSGTIMTSPDGVNWTQRTSPLAVAWTSAAYGNGVYVLFGPGSVISSSDGITWVDRTNGNTNTQSWQSVVYSDTLALFCAVSSDGAQRIVTSPDGIAWTQRIQPEANPWLSVTYGASQGFLAVSSTGTNRLMRSLDGISWSSVAHPIGLASDTFKKVAYGNSVYLIYDSSSRAYVSSDLVTWVQSPISGIISGLYALYFGAGVFLAFCGAGSLTEGLVTSKDGLAWSRRYLPAASNFKGVALGANRFVAVAASGGYRVITSGV